MAATAAQLVFTPTIFGIQINFNYVSNYSSEKKRVLRGEPELSDLSRGEQRQPRAKLANVNQILYLGSTAYSG